MSLYHRYVVEGYKKGPRLLLLAGIHGDECEPMLALAQMRLQIDAAHLRGRVTLIPVANESAFARGSRVGEDGLDLARTFPGKSDGSITERLAAELTAEIHDTDFFVDLHTGGNRVNILPMTGFMLHADRRVLEIQRQMAESFNLPIVWGTSPALEGRSLSAARDAHVPAIYAEYGGGGRFRAEAVSDYITGCLNVMSSLGMIEPSHSPPRVKHRMDDLDSDSGNLQLGHIATADGVFVPKVDLGDQVIVGQEIGRIVDLFTGAEKIVRAEGAGTVLMRHELPKVVRGCALCVLINLTR